MVGCWLYLSDMGSRCTILSRSNLDSELIPQAAEWGTVYSGRDLGEMMGWAGLASVKGEKWLNSG